MSIGRAVTVPYFPLCCVICYVATIVSLEIRYITVHSSFGLTSGVSFRQCQVVYADLDVESGVTAAGGTSDGSVARGVCEAFPGDWGLQAPVAEVHGMGAMVYGGPS